MVTIPLFFRLSDLFANRKEREDHVYNLVGVVAFIKDKEFYAYARPKSTADAWYEINDYNIGADELSWTDLVKHLTKIAWPTMLVYRKNNKPGYYKNELLRSELSEILNSMVKKQF